MSWLEQLAAELDARGVRGRARRRIILELRDHIACDPSGEDRLGDPQELAVGFAEELAADRARRSAFDVFAALAFAAVALAVSQLTIGHAGGYRGGHGSPVPFVAGLLGILVAPQVALVAGTLAALRALRRRRTRILPAAEIALIRRRAWVGLGGGFATVAGLELYVVDVSSRLPAWWLTLTGGLAGVAGVGLVAASVSLVRSGGIVSAAGGSAGDVFDDLPALRWGWLRRRPWRLGAIASLVVGTAITLVAWHAERSLVEGLERGVLEGLVAAIGFALFGRAIGVSSPVARTAWSVPEQSAALDVAPDLAGIPAAQLVADADRRHAELVLREGFSQGRLSLDELTARVGAVHAARTAGELEQALSGLPGRG